jgi:hypothetical protein
MKKLLSLLLGCCLVFIVGCENSNKMKFDKVEWDEGDDISSPPSARNKMLTDLIENHRLKGLKYNEVINLLGQPNAHDSTSFSYDIVIKYDVIDPYYVKSLWFNFSKDSVVTDFHVEEWEKGKEKKRK